MKKVLGEEDERGFTDQSDVALIEKREPTEMPQETNHSLHFYSQIN